MFRKVRRDHAISNHASHIVSKAIVGDMFSMNKLVGWGGRHVHVGSGKIVLRMTRNEQLVAALHVSRASNESIDVF
jgi:hypothetical protein